MLQWTISIFFSSKRPPRVPNLTLDGIDV